MFKVFYVNDAEDDEYNSSSDDNGDQLTRLGDDTNWQDLDTVDDHMVEQAMTRCCASRLACFAHTLQLTVRDGLEKLSNIKGQNMKTVIGKCVKLANLGIKVLSLFEAKLGAGRSIPSANATRWNSTYMQL